MKLEQHQIVGVTMIAPGLRIGVQKETLAQVWSKRISYQGKFRASTTQLTMFANLGPVQGEAPDGKTLIRWYFDTPHGPVEIYDYKGSPRPKTFSEMVDWNVGGNPDSHLFLLHAWDFWWRRN